MKGAYFETFEKRCIFEVDICVGGNVGHILKFFDFKCTFKFERFEWLHGFESFCGSK